MGESSAHYRGVVRNGVIVLGADVQLPEGAAVDVVLSPLEFTPEERAEFEAWDRLGDNAWSQIDWGEGEIARDSG